MSNILQGSCHCGNIELDLKTEKEISDFSPRTCGCSFCKRHGGLYISDPEGSAEIRLKNKDEVNFYQFGHKTADFLICKKCGVFVAATCDIDNLKYAVINIKTMPEYDFPPLGASNDYDAENTGSRMERRAKNWTPHVVIKEI